MESEKVKEIKKALEDNKTDHLPYIDGWKCKMTRYESYNIDNKKSHNMRPF